MENDTKLAYCQTVRDSIRDNAVKKLTFSKPIKKGDGPLSVRVRIIATDSEQKYHTTYQYQKRDEVKIYTPHQLEKKIVPLSHNFRNIDLFTDIMSTHLKGSKKGSYAVVSKRIRSPIHFETMHNREKNTIIKPQDPFLSHVGITTQTGEIRTDMKDKYNQLQKFVEITDILYKKTDLDEKNTISLLDCGSGKSCLTFALNFYFSSILNKKIQITGIDMRKDLTEASNTIALQNKYDNMTFVTGQINDFTNTETDIVTALHACNTATDDAIAKGINCKASIIIISPCCHKYIRSQMAIPDDQHPVLKYGLHKERYAEMLTDSLRALTLSYFGYETNIIEFVPSHHTPKNVLITAVKKRSSERPEIKRQIESIKDRYGLTDFYLDKQLDLT